MTIMSPCQSIVGSMVFLVDCRAESRTASGEPRAASRHPSSRRSNGIGNSADSLNRPVVPFRFPKNDIDVAAVLPQQLTAGAAGRRRRGGVGDDGDPREDRMPVRERLHERDTLGAEREAVGRVLDVAAADDRPSAVSSAAPTMKCEYARLRARPRVGRGRLPMSARRPRCRRPRHDCVDRTRLATPLRHGDRSPAPARCLRRRSPWRRSPPVHAFRVRDAQ